jgi:putative membrane protein
LGKALAILLLVFQVPATGGTYAIQLLPKFFQSLYNFLPLTYGIGALKEVIIGVYWSNYLFDISVLLLYPILGIIIALLVKGKLDKTIRYMESKLNDTGLF